MGGVNLHDFTWFIEREEMVLVRRPSLLRMLKCETTRKRCPYKVELWQILG